MIKALLGALLMLMATFTPLPITSDFTALDNPNVYVEPSTCEMSVLPISAEPSTCEMSVSPISVEEPLWQDCNVPDYIFTEKDVITVARMVYGEAECCNIEEQAGAVWCVLNRLDSDDPYFPNTVIEIVEQPNQFIGYNKNHPIIPELVSLVEDVFMRYDAEKSGIKDVGRVLPSEYLYFSGDGKCNYFTVTYASNDVWDWSLYNPYTE